MKLRKRHGRRINAGIKPDRLWGREQVLLNRILAE
jgi:hypothetical protein